MLARQVHVRYLSTILLLSVHCVHSINVTPNSPCLSQCSTDPGDTTAADIVCLDNEFTSTTNGSHFQQCVECELGSSAVDPKTGTTDAIWGLYNLRYALSSCMFGFPQSIVSLSSPCQVSCTPLSSAIESGLNVEATSADLSFCNYPNFTDAAINQCVFCYGLLDKQTYLANFLQALHVACHDPPTRSNPFPVTPSSIFNQTAIAPPTTSTAAPTSSSNLTGSKLALAIALPIIFSAILLAVTCTGCYFFTRRRRRRMAEKGGMRRMHAAWADSPTTPRVTHFNWDQAAIGMEQVNNHQPHRYSPQYLSYEYRDDVGPGPEQKKDHNLHDQYFPPPSPNTPVPTDVDEQPLGIVTEGHDLQAAKARELNLLHTPEELKPPQAIGVARGGDTPEPDQTTHPHRKGDKHNWI